MEQTLCQTSLLGISFHILTGYFRKIYSLIHLRLVIITFDLTNDFSSLWILHQRRSGASESVILNSPKRWTALFVAQLFIPSISVNPFFHLSEPQFLCHLCSAWAARPIFIIKKKWERSESLNLINFFFF